MIYSILERIVETDKIRFGYFYFQQKNIKIARKSIVAKCNIKKGEILSEQNICVKRPGDGINPMRWDEVIGQISQKDYKQDDLI